MGGFVLKKNIRDIALGIAFIMIGFLVGYGIWHIAAQGLIADEGLRVTLAIKDYVYNIFILAPLPAILFYLLWYRKTRSTPEATRQTTKPGDWYPKVMLIFLSTLILLSLMLLFHWTEFLRLFAYAAIMAVSVAGFSALSFLKCNPCEPY
jgi:MFS family permease